MMYYEITPTGGIMFDYDYVYYEIKKHSHKHCYFHSSRQAYKQIVYNITYDLYYLLYQMKIQSIFYRLHPGRSLRLVILKKI